MQTEYLQSEKHRVYLKSVIQSDKNETWHIDALAKEDPKIYKSCNTLFELTLAFFRRN